MTPTPIPSGIGTIAELVTAAARPTTQALVADDAHYTYAELAAAVDAGAAAYRGLGLEPGDRVAASGASCPELVIAFLAAQRAGLVWVGVNQVLVPAEKAFQLQDSGARLYLADSATLTQMRDLLPADVRVLVLREEPEVDATWPALVRANAGRTVAGPEIDPHAPAAIAYTSGTTGRPKGAVHSQHSIMTFVQAGFASKRGGPWMPGLRRTVSIPLTILNGMIFGPLVALAGGGSYVCVERADAASLADAIDAHGIETTMTVATVVYDLLHKPELADHSLASLRYVGAGGSFVQTDLKEAFHRRFGSELVEEYGLSEAPCGVVAGYATQRSPAGSVGRGYPHLEVAARDADGTVLGQDEVGELCVRAARSGPWADVYAPMLGYWNRPQETAHALRDGWLNTGDMGRVDADGWVYVVGRRGDVIHRGGANVYPAEVERVLLAAPRVEAVAVTGIPDERLGEVVAAYLQLAGDVPAIPGDLLDGLSAHCRTQLARYKMPQRWFVVDQLPRNAMNKVDKLRLRDVAAVELDGTSQR